MFDPKKIEALVKDLQSDKDLREKFEKEPTPVLEKALGMDLPDDQINQAMAAVKAKLTAESAGNLLGAVGGLLGKKE